MSRALKITFISLLMIVIIGVTSVFVLLMTGTINFDFFNTKVIYNENIDESFDKIKVSTTSLDVKLVKSSDEKVNVKIIDKENDGVIVKVEDNTLLIQYDTKKRFFLCFCKREAIISLPEKEYDLIVKSTSGDITSEVNLTSAMIITTSGDIRLNNVGDFKSVVTSGDIKANDVHNANLLATSGDIRIDRIDESVEIGTTSGDIKINELTIKKDSHITATSGDVTINKSSSNIYYNTEVTSGNVKIDNNNRLAEFELKIETKSGDIRVKEIVTN